MNGKEVVLEIRRLRQETPIIMLSGEVHVPEQVLKWVDAFVPKDHLVSMLLPAIAQSQDADRRLRICMMHDPLLTACSF